MKYKLAISRVLLVALFLTPAPTILANTTWYVDGVKGNNSNNCKSAQTACKTIGHAIALAPALLIYLQALAANLVSAGVRLIPIGQTDGQRVLAALEPVVAATAKRALATALGEVGTAAFRADLASMLHETQRTRLFRS